MNKSTVTIAVAGLVAGLPLVAFAPTATAAQPETTRKAAASSIAVTKITSGSGKVLRARFYADINGGGDRLEYWGSGNCSSTTADADFSMSVVPKGWNDRISSWNDYAGCDVKFFMDGGFHGAQTYWLNAGTSKPQSFGDRWNDEVSSFKVS